MPSETQKRERVHKKDHWYSEPRSPGIEPKHQTELSDNNDDLADDIKGSMFQDNKTAYSSHAVKKSHVEDLEPRFDHII